MKRKIFTLLMITLAYTGLQAQDLFIHKTDGTLITVPLSSIDSITFAESGGEFVCGTSTVTDIDGNTYNTVLIGGQCWLKENLKTTQYSNGTPIEYPGGDNNAWTNNTSGAYAWANNNIEFKDIYGGLYNWYAVNNVSGLCPADWHVPTVDEWIELTSYVISMGFPNEWENPNGAANTLKSCRQVNSPLGGECNTLVHPRWASDEVHHGSNQFDMTMFPGGYRTSLGDFSYLGAYGYYWSSSEYSDNYAHYRGIINSSGMVYEYNFSKPSGFTVRCVKD